MLCSQALAHDKSDGQIPGRAFFLASRMRFFARDSKFMAKRNRGETYGRPITSTLKIRSFMTAPASAALAKWQAERGARALAVLSFRTKTRRIFSGKFLNSRRPVSLESRTPRFPLRWHEKAARRGPLKSKKNKPNLISFPARTAKMSRNES